MYYKNKIFQHVTDISQDQMQPIKFRSSELDIITIYRSEKGNSVKLLDSIKFLITNERHTVICGDLNICYNSRRNNRITKYLEATRYKQVVKHPTHVKGRLIDHIYHNTETEVIVNQYTPYYADHDGICVIISTRM